MDKISNMLISIKNGGMANKESVMFPYSKLKNAIALCLEKEGYISSVAKKTKKGIPMLEVGLVYVDKTPKVKEVERVSKQSRRVYFGVKDIHTVRNDGMPHPPPIIVDRFLCVPTVTHPI